MDNTKPIVIQIHLTKKSIGHKIKQKDMKAGKGLLRNMDDECGERGGKKTNQNAS